jgi:hypothetical protein
MHLFRWKIFDKSMISFFHFFLKDKIKPEKKQIETARQAITV